MSAALLLTEDEAAELLKLCTRTLRRLRQAGEIRYVALAGRKIAYRPEDCTAYIEARVTQDAPLPTGKRRPRLKPQGNVVSFTARRRERLAGH